jgi:triacylglycerol esterase/lipase EstA (alpha/beta hydrolase family)
MIRLSENVKPRHPVVLVPGFDDLPAHTWREARKALRYHRIRRYLRVEIPPFGSAASRTEAAIREITSVYRWDNRRLPRPEVHLVSHSMVCPESPKIVPQQLRYYQFDRVV